MQRQLPQLQGLTQSDLQDQLPACLLLKSHGVTTVICELLPDDGGDTSTMNISSMIDTWIRLRLVEKDDRFERRVHVRKSRGQGIDQGVRSFRLTDRGIVIEKV